MDIVCGLKFLWFEKMIKLLWSTSQFLLYRLWYNYYIIAYQTPCIIKYSEDDIKKILKILIDNIFGNQVFQLTTGIPMGTNCAPFLADLFLYFYEAEFIRKLVYEKN
jgi:hypothetical protein